MCRLPLLFAVGVCILASLSSAQGSTQLGPIVQVDDDFGPGTPGWQVWRFATLQSGVNAVPSGGAVIVFAGDYAEDVVIDRPMRVRANVKHAPRLLGAGGASAVNVLVEGVTLEGLAFEVPGRQAVTLRAGSATLRDNRGPGLLRIEPGASDNVLLDNELVGVSVGSASSGAAFSRRNRIEGNQLVVMALSRSSHNLVRGNHIAAGGNTSSGCSRARATRSRTT